MARFVPHSVGGIAHSDVQLWLKGQYRRGGAAQADDVLREAAAAILADYRAMAISASVTWQRLRETVAIVDALGLTLNPDRFDEPGPGCGEIWSHVGDLAAELERGYGAGPAVGAERLAGFAAQLTDRPWLQRTALPGLLADAQMCADLRAAGRRLLAAVVLPAGPGAEAVAGEGLAAIQLRLVRHRVRRRRAGLIAFGAVPAALAAGAVLADAPDLMHAAGVILAGYGGVSLVGAAAHRLAATIGRPIGMARLARSVAGWQSMLAVYALLDAPEPDVAALREGVRRTGAAGAAWSPALPGLIALMAAGAAQGAEPPVDEEPVGQRRIA